MYERISHPQRGDLVLVMDSLMRRDDDTKLKGLGILLDHRDEYFQTDEEWQEMLKEEKAVGYDSSKEPRQTDHFWYIQYGQDAEDICRWTNCTVLTVLTHPFNVDSIPAGILDERGGVTFTRDSLLGGLADSGFALKAPAATEPRAT